MIRERSQLSLPFQSGQTVRGELSKDACYHQIQIVLAGSALITYSGDSAGSTFSQNFPFNVMNSIKLSRNGSDVVFQAGGDLTAVENLGLNGVCPRAWIKKNANGNLLAATVNNLAIISNSEGVGVKAAEFGDGGRTGAGTVQTNFECQIEIWLQLGVEDRYASTLVDARPLSSFVLEVGWASENQVIIPAAEQTLAAITATATVNSYDQDNVQAQLPFGTFKRSVQAVPNTQFSSSNIQQLLTRGNFYFGILFQTQTFKSGSTIIPRQEQNVITTLVNRVNTQYYLRATDFYTLQGKNLGDQYTQGNAYQVDQGWPRGYASLYYPMTGDRLAEMVPSFSMDTFDILLNTGAGNYAGAVTGGTLPIINMLVQEVIPGQSIAPNMPPAAFAGSIARTSASPYRG